METTVKTAHVVHFRTYCKVLGRQYWEPIAWYPKLWEANEQAKQMARVGNHTTTVIPVYYTGDKPEL